MAENVIGYAWITDGYEDWFKETKFHTPLFTNGTIVAVINLSNAKTHWHVRGKGTDNNLWDVDIPRRFIEMIPNYQLIQQAAQDAESEEA